MVSTLNAYAAVLPFLGLAKAAAYNPTHYAPVSNANTNLTILFNTPGAPGIFNSSTTPDSEYGEYNWCAMPHVRKTEYKMPPSGYQLQYVEVIQRHHKRTPYASNTFFVEDIPWDCDGQGPYAHYKHKGKFQTTPVYWQGEVNTGNPFEYYYGPGFINSTCQFPAITSEGINDAYVHGQDLRGVYNDLLGFLPDKSEREKYSWRVTNNVITSQTMSGVAKGLFPGNETYPAYIQNDAYDSLEPAFSCPTASAIKAAQMTEPGWVQHLNESSAVRARFYNVSGIQYNDTAGWKTSWDHPYDNLSAKQCHQKPLPCSVNDTSLCVSQTDANEIYRLGNYEYAYWWRVSENSTMAAALTMGPWLRELQGHMKGVIDGSNCVKYYHNFAHDGSVGPLIGALQIAEPVWPGMGSEVVFELWKSSNNTDVVRVLWSGQPMVTSTPLGTLDMVPFSTFNDYLNDLLPTDFRSACGLTS